MIKITVSSNKPGEGKSVIMQMIAKMLTERGFNVELHSNEPFAERTADQVETITGYMLETNGTVMIQERRHGEPSTYKTATLPSVKESATMNQLPAEATPMRALIKMFADAKETYTMLPSGLCLVCELTMADGTTSYGMYIVENEEDFDQQTGEDFALQQAREEAWKMDGANRRRAVIAARQAAGEVVAVVS